MNPAPKAIWSRHLLEDYRVKCVVVANNLLFKWHHSFHFLRRYERAWISKHCWVQLLDVISPHVSFVNQAMRNSPSIIWTHTGETRVIFSLLELLVFSLLSLDVAWIVGPVLQIRISFTTVYRVGLR